MRWPPANAARARSKEVYYIKSKKGKDLKRVKFTCELCGKKDLKSSQVELDHIIPVVDVKTSFVDWNNFIERLFVMEDGYQLICAEPCHREKTEAEDLERLKYGHEKDIKKKSKKRTTKAKKALKTLDKVKKV